MNFYNSFKNHLRSLHPDYYQKLDSNKVYIKYVIAGGAAASVDLFLLYVLTDFFHIWYLHSAVIAFAVAVFVSFYLQKFWTFRDNSKEKIRRQMIMYFAVGAGNLALNAAGMYLLVDAARVPYIFSQIIAGAGVAIVSFLVYRFLIFKNEKEKSDLSVLAATGIFPPDIGGPATYTKLLADELPKKGIKVEALSFGSVRHLPKIIRHFVYFQKALAAARRADIVYAQDPVSVGLPSVVAAKIAGKKFVIRIAGDYAWEQGTQRFGVKDGIEKFSARQRGYSFFARLLKKIQTRVARAADAIVVPSRYFKKIVENWGVEPQKINVIYNGIEPRNYPEERNSDGAKIILSVGRLVPWKGFKELIEAMPEILREIPEAKLVIAGDGPERERLEKTIARAGLRGKVVLAGKMEREDLLKLKKAAGVFVLNSGFESFSFDTVEAMAIGLPVVVSDVGSLPELVENGRDGVVVERNDKKQIKKAVVKILKDREFARKITQNAYQTSRRFSIHDTMARLEKLLRSLA